MKKCLLLIMLVSMSFVGLIAQKLDMAIKRSAVGSVKITNESPEAIGAIGVQTDNVLSRALKDIQQVERNLWNRYSEANKDANATGSNVLDAYRQARSERLNADALDGLIEKTVANLSKTKEDVAPAVKILDRYGNQIQSASGVPIKNFNSRGHIFFCFR